MEEKKKTKELMALQMKEDRKKISELEKEGKIDFDKLPVIEPRVREILLKWLSDAMESIDYSARTDDGRQYYLDMKKKDEKCIIHCTDGNFTMPKMSIVFK